MICYLLGVGEERVEFVPDNNHRVIKLSQIEKLLRQKKGDDGFGNVLRPKTIERFPRDLTS